MKMKIRKGATALLLAALFCASAVTAALGAEKGSLSLTVTDGDDKPAVGFKVVLCAVADESGVLNRDFAPAGIAPGELLDEKNKAENAKTLLALAKKSKGVQRVTDEKGCAGFANLDKGVYLVYGPEGQGYVFEPFLLIIPTVVGGETLYDIVSAPKVEPDDNPPGPGPEPTPTPGTEPTPAPTPGTEPTPSPTPSGDPQPDVTPTPGGGDPNPEVTPTPGGEAEPTPSPSPDRPVLPLTGVERRPIWVLLGLGGALVVAGVLQLCTRRKEHE